MFMSTVCGDVETGRCSQGGFPDEFDVAHIAKRNVLHRLEHDGLVLTRHGAGTTVTETDLNQIREASS